MSINTDAIEKNLRKKSEYSETLLDQKTSEKVMAIVMDYYIKMNRIVTQKLDYARKATRQRIHDIETADEKPLNAKMAGRFGELDELWGKLAAILKEKGLSVEEIEDIDSTFNDIPRSIKIYYDQLVDMDAELTKLVNEISSDQYRMTYEKAKTITRTIQKGKNLLSMLPEKEYDPPAASGQTAKKAAPAAGRAAAVRPDPYDFVKEPAASSGIPAASGGGQGSARAKPAAAKQGSSSKKTGKSGTIRTPDGQRMRIL